MPFCKSTFASSPQRKHSRSISGGHENILQSSHPLSHHNPKFQVEKSLHDRNSSPAEEMETGCSSTNFIGSPEIKMPKPAAELIKEIADLELEVIHLERYLLSLYRAAFDRYFTNPAAIVDHCIRSHQECHEESKCQESEHQKEHGGACAVSSYQHFIRRNSSKKGDEVSKSRAIDYRDTKNPTRHDLPVASDITNCLITRKSMSNLQDMKQKVPRNRSLADHLGASLIDHVPHISCRLSENILRCIAAIYSKLAHPTKKQTDVLTSPSRSSSSLSSSSPHYPSDWSPRCNYVVMPSPSQFELRKDDPKPYNSMVEIPKIFVDSDRFEYASKMLNIFRSLNQQLENVNPRKLKYEEQLAFWINIHNALVMHAFLAYGLHQNQMKSTFSILKAAYNIGGQSINAYDIQSSILRCQPHRPALWQRALLLPTMSFIKRNEKHMYALDQPDPLVHFALSLGAYSDPAVRIYTSKTVLQELNFAKEQFVQANVSITKENKIVLPKLLYYYAKDASLDLSELLEMVSDCMPEAQQKVIGGCLHERLQKCIEWSPYKSAFRYLLHQSLTEQ